MQLKIVGKFFSLTGSSYVVDENEQPRYQIKGKILTFTDKKDIMDMNNKVLYTIKNKFINFVHRKAYIMNEEGEKIAEIEKAWVLNNFKVKGYQDDIRIEGDIIAWQFDIYRNNVYIGHIHRKIIALTDTYYLDYNVENDAPFLVAIIGCIDIIYDKRQNENS